MLLFALVLSLLRENYVHIMSYDVCALCMGSCKRIRLAEADVSLKSCIQQKCVTSWNMVEATVVISMVMTIEGYEY